MLVKHYLAMVSWKVMAAILRGVWLSWILYSMQWKELLFFRVTLLYDCSEKKSSLSLQPYYSVHRFLEPIAFAILYIYIIWRSKFFFSLFRPIVSSNIITCFLMYLYLKDIMYNIHTLFMFKNAKLFMFTYLMVD